MSDKDLKVLAECVDIRSGLRFLKGQVFSPPPTLEQAERLIKAGCLPEGARQHAVDEPDDKPDDEPEADDGDLKKLTVDQLKGLAAERGVDLGDATKKADIIAALELAEEK